ncbi:MAG: hypothetical protein K8H88_19195, partial [Sandaracinaceae bacterium]|nr:hypothetical protein [Sandaracinaceae bacterium]
MRSKIALIALALGGLFIAACSGTSGTPDAGFPQSCQDIIDACHEVDPGTGPIHDCHETAHDVGTAAACDPIAANCVAMCMAFDGGSHDHDGGHADDAGAVD